MRYDFTGKGKLKMPHPQRAPGLRFVQHDDGQGNPKTLKIDNISISPN